MKRDVSMPSFGLRPFYVPLSVVSKNVTTNYTITMIIIIIAGVFAFSASFRAVDRRAFSTSRALLCCPACFFSFSTIASSCACLSIMYRYLTLLSYLIGLTNRLRELSYGNGGIWGYRSRTSTTSDSFYMRNQCITHRLRSSPAGAMEGNA